MDHETGPIPEKFGRNEALERLEAEMDWDAIVAIVADVYSVPTDRPAYPPLVMVKVMLLQRSHDASDAEMEGELNDLLTFRRFLGLGLGPTPDRTTIRRFRSQLAARGLTRRLFDEIDRQFDALGLTLRGGVTRYAELVPAPPDPADPAG